MRVLLVGGAGLIGSKLSKLLVDGGHQVLILDNFTFNAVEHRELGCEVISGNAASLATVNKTFVYFKPEIVFHLVDSLYDKDGVYDAQQEAIVSITVANNIISCIGRYGVKVVFFGSSGEIFCGGTKRPLTEISQVGQYSYTGAHKLYIENLFELATQQYGFRFSALRYFQVCGNRKFLNSKHDVLTFLINCVLREEEVVIVGPDTYIDILNVDDVALASYLVFKAVLQEDVGSVNIGSGVGVKLFDVYKKICEKIGVGTKGGHKYPPKRQTRTLVACNKKMMSFGWSISKPWLECLDNLIAYRESLINASIRR